MELTYRCLEPDCGWVTTHTSEEALLEATKAHMAEAHDTFELDEIILAGAAVDSEQA